MIVNNSNADLVTVKSDAEGVLRVRYTAGDLINQIDTIRVGDANSVPYDLSTYVTFTIRSRPMDGVTSTETDSSRKLTRC